MAFALNGGDVVQVTFRGTIFSQVCLTTFNFEYNGATITDGIGAFQDAADNMQVTTGLYTRYRNLMPVTWVGGQIWMQKIFSVRFRREVITPTQTSGLINDQVVSPADAVALLLVGNESGPRFRCVKHLPGLVAGSADAGELTPAAKDGYDLLALSAISPVVVSGANELRPIILNRANPAFSSSITGGSTMPEIRTMRRRVVRRGI